MDSKNNKNILIKEIRNIISEIGFGDAVELSQKKADAFNKSSNAYKMFINLKNNFVFAFNRFAEALEYNGIYDKNSKEAEDLFKSEFKKYLEDELKGTHYYFSKGKFNDLENISLEDFLNVCYSILDSYSYNDIMNDFSTRHKIAKKIAETMYPGQIAVTHDSLN